MQVAISGTYANGQVQLHELPPAIEESDVMVVFLPRQSVNSQPKDSLSSKKRMGFGMVNSEQDVDFEAMEADLKQLSKTSENHLLAEFDTEM